MIGCLIAGYLGGLIARNPISFESGSGYSTESCQEGWTPCPKCQPDEEVVGDKWKKTGCVVKRRNGGPVMVSPCPQCGSKPAYELLVRCGWYR